MIIVAIIIATVLLGSFIGVCILAARAPLMHETATGLRYVKEGK